MKFYTVYKHDIIYKDITDEKSKTSILVEVATFDKKYRARKCIKILKSIGVRDKLKIKEVIQ